MATITMTISNITGTCYIAVPEECPMCKSAIVPKVLHMRQSKDLFGDEAEGLVAALGCPACHRLFVAQYVRHGTNRFGYVKLDPVHPRKKEFDPVLSEVSPLFIEIYNQALAAEAYNLDQIAGMGYRKALEFLIKDYAKMLDPSASDEIERMMLSPCIQKYIEHPKIKTTATASAWLGNDETHYIRKFTDKDIEDLKRLINSCVYWVLADWDAEEASSMISK